MNKYLLEIGVEEMPAQYSASSLEQIENLFDVILKENNYNGYKLKTYISPRRLSIIVYNIDDNRDIKTEKIKGPAKSIAFDGKNEPTKALLGFLKSKNVNIKDIYTEKLGEQEYIFADIKINVDSFEDMIKKEVPTIIKSINFPKTMKWGGRDIKFVRPIRWIVSLYNDKVVSFDFEGIKVSNQSSGHRFLGQKTVLINSVDEYVDTLKKNYVLVDHRERKSIIRFESEKLAKSIGGKIQDDEAIIDQVTNLVEYPTPLLGTIKDKYLDLPDEVIITPMKDHLRYFPVMNDQNNLMNHFITVRNGNSDYIDIVRRGNERVLDARLEDAVFFFNEDKKKKFDQYVEDLKEITFQEKLGTLYDKSIRNKKLAEKICQDLQVADSTQDAVKRAAYLSKADLATKLVIEFTELQGVMGRIYSELSGEDKNVSNAIFEHYLPRFNKDELPKTTAGAILSLTDKMDTLCGLFAVNIRPTGSQDPFGLRRAALGIISVILNNNMDISLSELIKDALYNYVNLNELMFDYEEVYEAITSFIKTRFEIMMLDMSYDKKYIKAIMNKDEILNLQNIKSDLNKLQEAAENYDLSNISESYNRINNILKNKTFDEVEIDTNIMDEEENTVFEDYKKAYEQIKLFNEDDYLNKFKSLDSLSESVKVFFDNIMILVDNVRIRNNRLNLIKKLKELYESVTDFSAIEEV